MRLTLLIAILAACGQPGATTADAPGAVDGHPDAGPDLATIATWHGHADDALATLLIRYWTPGAAYLGDVAPATGALTQYWTFAQAFDAVLDGVARTGGARFGGWIEALYLAQDARGWSRDFYDDENWMALALLRAEALTHDPRYLDRATQLFTDIEAAWDTTCCGPQPGGLWWDRPHTQKATAANAGAVITAVRLAARTGDARYLAFARQVYGYWRATMVDPGTFAVADHVVPGGQVTHYRFTYNEGLMIGAAVALHGATAEPGFLDDARHIAGYMLAEETVKGAAGPILFDGTNSGCGGDCQQFKGIGFRYLQQLAAAAPSEPAYPAVLTTSAHAIWDLARASSGLFAADWAGPPTDASSIAADSSATMALNLYAAGLGAYPPLADPATRHQAEDGVVHGLGLEASHGVFGGWGYLAGWHADGQWVDLHVTVPTAGRYTLTLRYAAGGGDAARLLYVNGATLTAAQRFASTGSWDAWASVTTTAMLPAGPSTISVIYNGGMGSSGYLNLDWVDVTP